MDKWISDNPKSAAYMLYLSAVVVLLSIIALYYFRKSREYGSRLIKMSTEPKTVKKAPLKGELKEEVEEKDGFTIIEDN